MRIPLLSPHVTGRDVSTRPAYFGIGPFSEGLVSDCFFFGGRPDSGSGMSWQQVVVLGVGALLTWGQRCRASDKAELDFTTIDVGKLATHVYGTELFLLENRYRDQSLYRFEDFFWTGSGEGSDDEETSWNSETPTTVYKTKTVLTTVFIESPVSSQNETNQEPPTKCSLNCATTPSLIPEGEISPSPASSPSIQDTAEELDENYFDADRQFWLLTVLKSDGTDPVIIDLKNSLEKLYKTAFQRQQERHLGINHRIKRKAEEKPVKVYIHKMDKSKLNGDKKIEVLYHVSVAGKPVSAITAAKDMTLVSDEEVRQELGYPFLIKAEPYLKPTEPQSLSGAKSTWAFIGVSIIGLLVFLLVVAFLTLALTKRKKVATPPNLGVENRQHIFERGVGQENKGYTQDSRVSRANKDSPTYINYRNEQQSTLSKGAVVTSRPESSISSTSSSSGSLDISPLMGLKKKQRFPPKKTPRPRAAINKTGPMNLRKLPAEVFDSDSSCSRKDFYVGNYDPGVVSPKSYLSMPSVISFPRGNMPEPLNKVLEPVSILHLDMPEEEANNLEMRDGQFYKNGLARHGSVGAVEDPGVIGPIVWNMHCQRLQHGVSVDEGMDDLKVDSNVTKMRKRFHDLLDDTFSLFGSSPVPIPGSDSHSRNVPIEVKSHSAANNRPNDDLKAPTPKPRPKTTDLRRVDHRPGSSGPKGAWSSKAPSPLVRPLSAGIINPHPRVNVDHVLAEGKFRSNDPAVPLIAAIKSEIERVSLPGSTADIRD